MIKLTGINVEFYRPIFKDLEVSFNLGKVYALFGPSGCGKTTLLNIINGNIDILDGKYFVNQKPLQPNEIKQFSQEHIFYLTQEASFVENISCYDNLRTVGNLVNNELTQKKIEEVLKQVGLEINEKIYPKQLSGGEKQRLQIALALIKETDVLLCDEITRSLDHEHKENILAILKDIARQNKLVIIASHDDLVKNYCDEVYEIKDLHIVNDEIDQGVSEMNKSHQHSKRLIKTLLKGNFRSGKMNYIFYSLFMIIAVCLCFIASQASHQYTENLERLSNSSSKNIFYVFNPVDPRIGEDRALFDGGALPLTNQQINTLQSMEEVKASYPFYYGSFLKGQDGMDSWKFTVEKEGEISEIDYPVNQNSNYLLANYPQEDMEKYCIDYIKGEKGIYLSYHDAKKLGIENLKQKTILKFNVDIPVAYVFDEHASIVHENGYFEYRGTSHIFKEVTIELPVVGILEETHGMLVSSLGYIDFETMENIYLTAKESYQLQEGEISFEPFVYVFVLNEDDYTSVYEQVHEMEGNAYVYSIQKNIHDFMSGWLGLETPMKLYTMVIFFIMVILVIVYSFLEYRKNKHDLSVMYQWGVNKTELQKYFASKILQLFLILAVGSLTLFVVLYQLAIKQGILIPSIGSHEVFRLNMIGCIVFSFVIALVTYLISYFKGIRQYHD